MELARALHPYDVNIVMASMGAPVSRGQRAQVKSLSNVRMMESRYRLEWMDDPWADVERAGEWLLALEARESPDIIHLNGYTHGALPWRAPVCVVAHSCVLSWWRAVHGEEVPPSWHRYRAAVRAGLSAASAVVAPSGAMLDRLAEYDVPLSCPRVIHNGRDAARFPTGHKEPVVLTVGRVWDEAKNVALVERVAAALPSPWQTYIAGAVGTPNGASGANGGSRDFTHARYLGRLEEPELAAWMARASIYALPARYEPFGLSALEAALAGCALVLGDIPSLREIWGSAALYVSPDDHTALREAITRLAADDALRSRMARHARRRAARYTPARMAAEYQSLYAMLLSSAARASSPEGACAS
jgi:glycosyltransferase involved in cell wall biosynthesis